MAQHEPATTEQIAERKQIVRNLITAGYTQAQIVHEVRDKYAEWGISDRQVRNYVKAAYEDMSLDAGLVDRAAYFIRTLERFDDLYSRAIKGGNLKVAHEANVSISKLLKLENPSAAMDWRKAATAAGLEPERMVKQLADLFAQVGTDAIQ